LIHFALISSEIASAVRARSAELTKLLNALFFPSHHSKYVLMLMRLVGLPSNMVQGLPF
jgi:hypothetical protein